MSSVLHINSSLTYHMEEKLIINIWVGVASILTPTCHKHLLILKFQYFSLAWQEFLHTNIKTLSPPTSQLNIRIKNYIFLPSDCNFWYIYFFNIRLQIFDFLVFTFVCFTGWFCLTTISFTIISREFIESAVKLC